MTYFDERAKEWDSDPVKLERAKVVAQTIRERLPLKNGMTALEYGCGTGLLSFALQDAFASITLADTSQGMLDVLAKKIQREGLGHMYPLLLDLASAPSPIDRFDVIYSLMTMHHILDTENYLNYFHKLLYPGGFLCIADLEKEDGSFHGQGVKDVHNGFDRVKFQSQLESAQFGDIQFTQVFEMKRLVEGQEKVFPIFLMVARHISGNTGNKPTILKRDSPHEIKK